MTMESMELKTKCHNLIDLIDDDDILEDFYFAMDTYYKRDRRRDIIDDLTDDQINRLDESIHQSESGKTIPHETVRAEIKQWLMK
ncbi:MAG TPA: hypothetical protein VK186_16590 [Candidatus Deferrimicrobium sp.]|nr:hypothetical protein [Candidatus Kapabacteria bacterium]HLP60460.1 hypothetical protein [Candidatus Deferrimicrobium sp.]